MSRPLADAAAALLARQPQPTIVTTRRGPVEIAVVGDGPAVLSLHGGMGGYDQGLLLAQALLGDRSFKIVSVSRPGHLGTPLASGATPDVQADLYADLLDTLDIPDTSVIAVSAGGASALRFAARHPDRCRRMILVSACSGHLDVPLRFRGLFMVMSLVARWPALAAWIEQRRDANPDRAAARSIPDPEQRACTLRHPEAGPLMLALQTSTRRGLAERMPGTWNDIAAFRRATSFVTAAITAPVLVVHGTADPAVPFAHARSVIATVPVAELLTIEGGQHVALFSHLDEIRARALRFLAAVPSAERAPPAEI